MKKRVSTEAHLTPDCKSIIGSFSVFYEELRANGFGDSRIKVTYEVLEGKTKKLRKFREDLETGEYQRNIK